MQAMRLPMHLVTAFAEEIIRCVWPKVNAQTHEHTQKHTDGWPVGRRLCFEHAQRYLLVRVLQRIVRI